MQTMWGNHVKKSPPDKTEAYELKICKGKSMPFDSVRPHQIEALQAVSDFLYYKITDAPVFYGMKTRFHKPSPFDCFCIVKSDGYLIIWFYVPRTPKRFIKIKIANFLKLRKNADRKSMTEIMAFSIADEVIYI